ncbi:Retrovirus-related Pol polyprotein from transposon TNT 1-94 [Vitis vinifera]|uniref:Retrovirus-related Pol polyprotein from transposon TNT 1-94 n=1 Tax=Vitis vinifera TaxID=29760 RepID=A0A438G9L5_VITVI|nr:Retrovirus-related Pol polyprotein from transposon TNT 1-94 [Vitis vinifera]
MKLKDLKVKNYLFQAIDKTILETILQKNTSKQIWDSMKKKYEGNARVKRSILQALRRDFETLEMKSVEEQALKVTTDERIGAGGRGRNSYRGRGRGRGRQALNRATVECYRCHQLGHFQYDCPTWNKEVNYAELEEHEDVLLMAYVEEQEAMRNDVWFLDSGYSNHMCGDARMFSELDESFRQQVKLENNSKITVKGRGNVRLQLNGFNYVLKAVFYVSELKNNLLSIGQLQEKGLAIMIHDGLCKIYHPGLNILKTKNMVRGLPHLLPTTLECTDCLNGKQHRDPIPKKSAWRGNQKAVAYTCRYLWSRAPTSNGKKRLVEKETRMYIKCLRTDRGGEFNSEEFNEFCRQCGIKRQLTIAYTPQQNGVAERKNRTVMNMKSYSAVKNVTPEEAWSGVKPTVEHFRVFGCVAHVHVPDSKRTKLDNKSLELGVDTSYEEQVLVDLESSDDDKNNTEDNEGDAAVTDASDAPAEGSYARERRVRRTPIWMEDYISGEGLSEGEIKLNMALVASTDPINYEEAVMSSKWRLAMDSEINSIEKIKPGNLLTCQLVPKPLE